MENEEILNSEESKNKKEYKDKNKKKKTIHKDKENKELDKSKRKKIIGIICFVIFVILVIAQIAFIFINEQYGYEYIYEWIFNTINFVALAFLLISCLCLLKSKKIKIITTIIVIAFCVANSFYMYAKINLKQNIINYSPDRSNCVILKRNKKNGKAIIYRKNKKIFCYPKKELKQEMFGDIQFKLNWLTNDICTITYEDNDDKTHQYVATFGSRGDAYVTNAISGRWETRYDNEIITLECNNNYISVSHDNETQKYSFKDCAQFGDTAIVLCKDGVPQWTVALNNNCELGEASDIIESGTITINRVDSPKELFKDKTYNPDEFSIYE